MDDKAAHDPAGWVTQFQEWIRTIELFKIDAKPFDPNATAGADG